MAKFDKSVLATYGIQTGTAEVLYNPSYEVVSTPAVRLRTSSSLMMRPLTTLYGGILKNIITTTTAPARRLGTP